MGHFLIISINAFLNAKNIFMETYNPELLLNNFNFYLLFSALNVIVFVKNAIIKMQIIVFHALINLN